MGLFHVKQPNPFRTTAMASAYGAPLLGNSDGQQDGVLRLLALAVGLYARALHHGQSPGHGVEKQPHILNYKGWFFSGGLVCRMKQGFHILLRPGHSKPLLYHMPGGRALELRLLQAEQRPGVALGAAALPQQGEDIRREAEQAQLVGHRRLGLADAAGW